MFGHSNCVVKFSSYRVYCSAGASRRVVLSYAFMFLAIVGSSSGIASSGEVRSYESCIFMRRIAPTLYGGKYDTPFRAYLFIVLAQ